MSKSKLFLYLAFSFILGVGFTSYFKIWSYYFYFIAAVFFLILIIVWYKINKIKIIGLCGLFFILGIFRFIIANPIDNSNRISFYNDQEEIEFQGLVAEESDIREDKIKLTIATQSILEEGIQRNINGKVLVDVERFPEYSYGDLLNITCQLQTPAVFDDFNYKDYLAKSDIYSVCYKAQANLVNSNQGNKFTGILLKIKNKFSNIISLVLPEPQASFLKAMLLGLKNGLSDDFKESFNITGTSHIIVISGLHIAIVAGILLYITKILSFSRKYSLAISIIGLVLFIFLIGAHPSSVRAGIMGSLIILAMYSGRLSDTKNAIICAALIIILINPKVLKFDAGFQMSFLATIGIIYLSPYLKKFLKFIPNIFKFREIIAMTLAAQILTLPVIIYNFERISIISPIVNVLIIPLVPVAIVMGFISLFSGLVWIYLGKLIAIITWFALQYIISVVKIFSKIPLASIEVNKIWVGWIIFYYIIVMLLIWHLRKKEKLTI